jgi:hypothetical protein
MDFPPRPKSITDDNDALDNTLLANTENLILLSKKVIILFSL